MPPTMADVSPKLAMESLAKIYGESVPGLPTVEFPARFEKPLRRIISLNDAIGGYKSEIKRLEKELDVHSVAIAEMMAEHEHGVLETTEDRILIDFVSKSRSGIDRKKLQSVYPDVYEDVKTVSTSRSLKVSIGTK